MCWGQCPYLEAEGEGQAATARRSARKCPLRRPRGGGANADAVRRTVDAQKRWPTGRLEATDIGRCAASAAQTTGIGTMP